MSLHDITDFDCVWLFILFHAYNTYTYGVCSLKQWEGGGGSTTCIKKKYTVHVIIITVHVVKINTLLCLEEEKILVRKDNALKVFIRMIMNIAGKYINDDHV